MRAVCITVQDRRDMVCVVCVCVGDKAPLQEWSEKCEEKCEEKGILFPRVSQMSGNHAWFCHWALLQGQRRQTVSTVEDRTQHTSDTAVLWSLCLGSILTDGSQFKIAHA